ncbi:uncharacterized protein [Equus caballus]|uniref:uncharacterized protein n=1 Tax=Equus caballus TaxID=9796 RepID=UPI0038B34142
MPGKIPTRVPVRYSSAQVKGSRIDRQLTGAKIHEPEPGAASEGRRRGQSGLAPAKGTVRAAKFTQRKEGGGGPGKREAAPQPGSRALLRGAPPARVVGASNPRTHLRGDAKTRLAVCLARSGAPSEMRALQTQTPKATTAARSSPALLALPIPDAADLLHAEKRRGLVFQGLSSLPCPTRPATRFERQESQDSACRCPQSPVPKEKMWEVPGGNWRTERLPFGSLARESDRALGDPQSPSTANPSSCFSTRGRTAPRPASAGGGFRRRLGSQPHAARSWSSVATPRRPGGEGKAWDGEDTEKFEAE